MKKDEPIQERYDRILEEAANRSVNQNASGEKQLDQLLRAMWPDQEFGFFNDHDFPKVVSDRGGAWSPLTAGDWEDVDEWNSAVSMRLGITENNGVLKFGIHNIVHRSKKFADQLRAIHNNKTEQRLNHTAKEQKEAVARAAEGRGLATAELKTEYQRAKEAPDGIVTDKEELANRKLQTTVPSQYKKQMPAQKRGRPKKAMPGPVDKTGDGV